MYIRGKDTNLDKLRRIAEKLTLQEKKEYYQNTGSMLMYYNTCYELGEITKDELLRLRQDFLFGKVNNESKNIAKAIE